MKTITVKRPGGTEELIFKDYPTPKPKKDEVLIQVKAAALNRADIMQREGHYDPPAGTANILGLEVSGYILKTSPQCKKWKEGDRVFALLPGGGYAEQITISSNLVMPIPQNLSFEEAASIPESFLTAYQALHWLGNLQPKQIVLIHAGASGVGTAAIQLVHLAKAIPFVTAGSKSKLDFCINLGAKKAINYKKSDFAKTVLKETSGKGADIILDFIGSSYWATNIKSLSIDGKLILLAVMSGHILKDADLSPILMKRLQVIGSTLRSRPIEYKAKLIEEFTQVILPYFTRRKLSPVVDRIFPWQEVKKAHKYMEANKNRGKIVLTIN